MANDLRRGVGAAKKFHDENTGAPFKSVILKDDGNSVVVRVLQKADDWLSLFMHRDWNAKVPSTRCADQADEPDMEVCLMCAHGIGRQLRTYIPVRVRGDDNMGRVQFFDYGRDNLAEVINQLEELKEGQDVTGLDFKVKRQGKGTDTKYRWVPAENIRELTDDEKALVIPDLAELIVVPSEAKMKNLCIKFGNVADDDAEDEKPKGGGKTPF